MRQALADRLTQAEALRAVGDLLSAFPNGSPANAKGYIGALAAILGDYPKSVALRCADIRKGVARETRFLPTVADLVAWCERETASLRGIVEKDDHYERLANDARERARREAKHAAERKARPSLADLQAKHGPSWGIAAGQDDAAAAKAANIAQIARANQRTFARECEAAGVDPNGMASPTLRALLHPPELLEAAE